MPRKKVRNLVYLIKNRAAGFGKVTGPSGYEYFYEFYLLVLFYYPFACEA